MLFTIILLSVLVGITVTFNVIVATTMTKEEMKRDLYYGQCFAGKIFANILYSLAWTMKVFYRDTYIEKRRAYKTLCDTIEEWLTFYDTDEINICRENETFTVIASKGKNWYPIDTEVSNSLVLTESDIDKITNKYGIGYVW